jgi:mRNA interferase MazF
VSGADAPERGGAVWLDCAPRSGHEQDGRRPALVLSPRSYHARTGLALVCPITRHAKGYPFEVALPAGFPVEGVVLADQASTQTCSSTCSTRWIRGSGAPGWLHEHRAHSVRIEGSGLRQGRGQSRGRSLA